MAKTWNSRRLRHERDMDRRLKGELRAMATDVGRVVIRYAQGGVVPELPRVQSAIRRDIWAIVKAYYVGPGDQAFDGPRPQSPFAQLIFDGIEGAVRIQAERTVVMLRKYLSPTAMQFLTAAQTSAGDGNRAGWIAA